MNTDIRIEFERECYKCDGASRWIAGQQCDRCNNTGRVATELGQELLDFLEHQGFKRATKEAASNEH